MSRTKFENINPLDVHDNMSTNAFACRAVSSYWCQRFGVNVRSSCESKESMFPNAALCRAHDVAKCQAHPFCRSTTARRMCVKMPLRRQLGLAPARGSFRREKGRSTLHNFCRLGLAPARQPTRERNRETLRNYGGGNFFVRNRRGPAPYTRCSAMHRSKLDIRVRMLEPAASRSAPDQMVRLAWARRLRRLTPLPLPILRGLRQRAPARCAWRGALPGRRGFRHGIAELGDAVGT